MSSSIKRSETNHREEARSAFHRNGSDEWRSLERVDVQKAFGRIFAGGAIVVFAALGVRLLSWHDTRYEVGNVQTLVTEGYKVTARLLLQGGITSFLSASSPLSDLNLMGHPPGYPILLALLSGISGESDAAVQFIQIACDATAALAVFLIALELFSIRVAIVAGLLIALSPQFAWNAVLLLPDTLAVLPILLAVYCLIRARKRPRLATILMAGGLVGVSCWFRANALLLAPFLAIVVPVLFERGKRLRYALALVSGTVLVISPLTLRNAIVFNRFIPLSLGAGQTLLEGIADYDEERRFGLPMTDLGIMKMEAEQHRRPDYQETLFGPDGIKRDRMRLARGFAVIRSHPLWFFGVMIRRAASMLRLERARLISADPPVTHPLGIKDEMQPVWASAPPELLRQGIIASPQAEVSLARDGQLLYVRGDDSKYKAQIISQPIAIQKNTDYVLKLPVKIKQGRVIISVISADSDRLHESIVIETLEGRTPEEEPLRAVQIPFVSSGAGHVQAVLGNGASRPVRPVVQIGSAELFTLGPASYVWTRYPRMLIRNIQKLYLTALMLPLVFTGVVLLVRWRRGRTLAILLSVPAYYFCIQSALHTEYRYVLTIHYFLFIIVAVALCRVSDRLWSSLRKISVTQQ